MKSYLPLLIIPGFLVLFTAFWCLVCVLIARGGGWATLARQYKWTEPAPGPRFHLQSGEVNGGVYKAALTFGMTPQGLFLDVLPLFRPGHAPLLIPWSRMSDFEPQRTLFMTSYTTTVTVTVAAGSGTVRLTLYSKRLADLIQLQLSAVSPSAARSATGHRSAPD